MKYRNKKGQFKHQLDYYRLITFGIFLFIGALAINHITIQDTKIVVPKVYAYSQESTPTPSPTPTVTQTPIITPSTFPKVSETTTPKLSFKDYVFSRAISEFNWSGEQLNAIDYIITHESSWRSDAVNKSSGACSAFQALPCSKIKGDFKDWKNQTDFGLNYLKQRYGNPIKAMQFWKAHKWY